ncbi:BPSS1780 family membrane protein [Xenorhabdus innexi]|uniref:Membrane protein n=1 Tax=Xenorhabdus innexi TaxID=290109 RepID=A0A1N6MXI6_9GAMM|nr:BPSS1780 family membrane protein [Xenorhabdus innexi]PHM33241.1 membrane protein [Xenorhabdus innexi]SIP73593.1 conserved membrane hypothetical protein [Xenorhabdus innexi]
MNNQDINLNPEKENASPNKETEVFIRHGQSVGAGAAIQWIGDAWRMFKAKPFRWILFTLVYTIIIGIISFIPLVKFVFSLFGSVFIAGIITAAETQRTTGDFKISLLFYGFKEKLGSLIAVSVFYIVIYVIGAVVAVLIAGDGMVNLFLDPQHVNIELLAHNDPGFIWAILVLFIFILIAIVFTWFAPALIIINKVNFSEALLMSFSAVKKNLIGGFIFFLLMSVLFIVSAIPLFLGCIITLPMLLISYYTTYRSIFYTRAD